jgi:hypothetical protein
MGKAPRRGLTFDVTPWLEELGLAGLLAQIGTERVIEEIGKKEVIRRIGKKEFIEEIGKKEVIEQIGPRAFLKSDRGGRHRGQPLPRRAPPAQAPTRR